MNEHTFLCVHISLKPVQSGVNEQQTFLCSFLGYFHFNSFIRLFDKNSNKNELCIENLFQAVFFLHFNSIDLLRVKYSTNERTLFVEKMLRTNKQTFVDTS